jgi:hypothetical protein
MRIKRIFQNAQRVSAMRAFGEDPEVISLVGRQPGFSKQVQVNRCRSRAFRGIGPSSFHRVGLQLNNEFDSTSLTLHFWNYLTINHHGVSHSIPLRGTIL